MSKSKSYLQRLTDVVCRNLMAKDEFKNLGFADERLTESSKDHDVAKKGDETEKNELKW